MSDPDATRPDHDLTRRLLEALKDLRGGDGSPAPAPPEDGFTSAILEKAGLDTDTVELPEIAASIARQERERYLNARTTTAPRELPDDAPRRLGHYVPTGELGRGGMGLVLEAKDLELRRPVAIKLLREDRHPVGAREVERFINEARITGQLQHPNIVQVHELSVSDEGQFFMVMNKVEGRTLHGILKAQQRGEPDGAAWTRHRLLTALVQVCKAIAYAHERGVLHRDIKPGNIIFGDYGQVFVVDWGVAGLIGRKEKRADDPPSLEGIDLSGTLAQNMVGTPGYMSPEQLQQPLHELDGRADVFALGAVLYKVLTLTDAFPGSKPYDRIQRVFQGPPTPPRIAAPLRPIPQELADIAMQAMSSNRDDRFLTARDLAAALEGFLEGSARQERAAGFVAATGPAWARYRALGEERSTLLQRRHELSATVPPWAPLEDKAELLAVRERLGGIETERGKAFGEFVGGCEKALSQDPENQDARRGLARAWFVRFEEAEAAGDEADRLYYEERVRAFDDGTYADQLVDRGTLSLRSDPDGAEVFCQRVVRKGLVWDLEKPARRLGVTPLNDLPLDGGSYLLTLRTDGRVNTKYPALIRRGRRWEQGQEPVRLLREPEVRPGFVHVPAGPCLVGGDEAAGDLRPLQRVHVPGFLVARLPVTVTEYALFLDAVSAEDPAEAWLRVPRRQSGLGEGERSELWARPRQGETYRPPKEDHDGEPTDPRWAVTGISWHDACAYTMWRARVDGLPYRLLSELEWEKAARGVDGRIFPWGNTFDATLCKMLDSRAGRPRPEAVGAFETDVSVYGVRDVAGGVRDWCRDAHFDGDSERRPVRGGAWLTIAQGCRLARRLGIAPWAVHSFYGFRLSLPVPAPAPVPRAAD